MARPATGQVVCDERRKSPVFALRFRAYGRREFVTLGSVEDGWTPTKAEEQLQNVLADVRRGIWRPPHPEPAPVAPVDPNFHEFASEWFEANKGEWRPNTRVDYGWQLTNHLLPFFPGHRLSQITIAEVDRYRAAKVREGVLSATSINKTITRLAQILEVAVEYEMIDLNHAKGKRRRVKASKPAPVWLDRGEQITALLDAAGEVDREARAERLTPHKLRHTFASLLVALGVDPGSVMDQLGHTDPAFALRVYRHGMRRDDASKLALRELVGLSDWAAMGSSDASDADMGLSAPASGQQKTPR